MDSNLEAFKSDLAALMRRGKDMDLDMSLRHLSARGELDKEGKELAKKLKNTFESGYQRWFTEASAVVRQLIPNRLTEFEELYRGNGKRKAIIANTYHIQDWLNGVRAAEDYMGKKPYDDFAVVSMRFKTQLAILDSATVRFESRLTDIRQLVQASLFDSELDAARELLKCGFLRGSGAIAGVVLEKHLSQVASNHNVSTKKKSPTISDLNDILKNGGVLDIPNWRLIQRLGDIRNMCDHNKSRDPTNEEIEELVDAVEKLTKTLF